MAKESNSVKKLHYAVILDTNTLIFGNPFRSEVVRLIKNFKSHGAVEIKYYIPKVVAEEFKSKLPKRIHTARAAYGNATKEITGLMGVTFPEVEIFPNEAIKVAGENALKKYDINILDTPSVGLADILKKAIYHEPPFKSEGDAGLKDELIAETVKSHAPGMSNDSVVVFICSDETFRKYMTSISEEFRFKVYQSIDEFESELKLQLLLTGEETKLVDTLAKAAEAIFFRDEEQKTLFYKEALPRLHTNFPTLFSNPQPEQSWTLYSGNFMGLDTRNGRWSPIDKAKYEIFRPLFLEKTGENIFIWESTVIYSQNFENLDSLRGYVYSGSVGSGSQVGSYNLRFTVKWSVKLNSEGKFDLDSAKVIDVDHIKDRSVSGGWTVNWPQTPISGPTGLSGTVTLEEVDKI